MSDEDEPHSLLIIQFSNFEEAETAKFPYLLLLAECGIAERERH